MPYKEKIRLIMINAGINQKQIAERLGTSEKVVSFWLTGRATTCKHDLKDKIDALYCREVLKQQSFL